MPRYLFIYLMLPLARPTGVLKAFFDLVVSLAHALLRQNAVLVHTADEVQCATLDFFRTSYPWLIILCSYLSLGYTTSRTPANAPCM